MTSDLPPNQTLYLNNLNERVKKEEMKKSLYALFSHFGPIVEVIALKTNTMRGQAFIIFKEIQSATKALRAMQSFPFYEKPMRINYAKSKSHLVARLEGTFVEGVTNAPKDTEATSTTGDNEGDGEGEEEEGDDGEGGEGDDRRDEAADGDQPATKKVRTVTAGGAAAASPALKPDAMNPPCNRLFVTGLPEETTELVVQMLFQQFPGFQSVNLVAQKGMAFVAFDTIMHADVAMTSLQGFKVKDDHFMLINFAK